MGVLLPATAVEIMPSVFNDFFRPWDDLVDNGNLWKRAINIPAVNITEEKNEYQVSLAVPGMKRDDFKIDVDGNMLTISSEKEESKEEKDKKFTRKEYNYSSFTRTFTLPEEVSKEKIEAKYQDGILKITLPFDEKIKRPLTKHIPVK